MCFGGIPTELLDMQHILHGGKNTYVISEVGIENKFSKDYGPCTGIAMVGTSRASGENISAMTHQVPGLEDGVEQKFESDLRSTLRELTNRSTEGTIDIVFYGGLVSESEVYAESGKDLPKKYNNIRENIVRICKEETGVDVRVALDPKAKTNTVDDVYLDTPNRRLYIRRT